MKKSLIVFFLAVLPLFSALASSGSHFGQAQYFAWPEPFFPEGMIVINDAAATAIYNEMTNARFDPAEPDLEQRHPSMISLEDCEGKIGANIICRKVPQMGHDSVVRDAFGNVIYNHQCFVDLDDVTTGLVGDFGQ